MFPSWIAGHVFMNLRLIVPEEGKLDLRGGYLLTRYEIMEKDDLTVWLLDDRWAETALDRLSFYKLAITLSTSTQSYQKNRQSPMV
jgi:trehalose/maltose hydrolase-like predicted phosphorylase|tara:strand:- start:904 stop:1161 length:258 start_codon:yes stop_codon:yes gene_type:complete